MACFDFKNTLIFWHSIKNCSYQLKKNSLVRNLGILAYDHQKALNIGEKKKKQKGNRTVKEMVNGYVSGKK